MTSSEDLDRVLRQARAPTPPVLLEDVLKASNRWARLNNALRATLDEIPRARQAWRALLGSKPAKAAEWVAYGRVRALERRAARISTILEEIERRTERKVAGHG